MTLLSGLGSRARTRVASAAVVGLIGASTALMGAGIVSALTANDPLRELPQNRPHNPPPVVDAGGFPHPGPQVIYAAP